MQKQKYIYETVEKLSTDLRNYSPASPSHAFVNIISEITNTKELSNDDKIKFKREMRAQRKIKKKEEKAAKQQRIAMQKT